MPSANLSCVVNTVVPCASCMPRELIFESDPMRCMKYGVFGNLLTLIVLILTYFIKIIHPGQSHRHTNLGHGKYTIEIDLNLSHAERRTH